MKHARPIATILVVATIAGPTLHCGEHALVDDFQPGELPEAGRIVQLNVVANTTSGTTMTAPLW